MVKVLINQKTLIILNQLKVWIKDNFLKDVSPQSGALWFLSMFIYFISAGDRVGSILPVLNI